MKKTGFKASDFGVRHRFRASGLAAVWLLAFAVCGTTMAKNGVGGARNVDPNADPDALLSGKDEAAAPELKEPRWLLGLPEKDTSAEQLAYARQLEKKGKISRARKEFNALVHEWGNSPEAPVAQLGVAALYESGGNFADAFKEYQYFIENYANGVNVEGSVAYEDIIAQQFAVANMLRSKMNTGWFSSPSVDLVTSAFRKIVNNAPDWKRAPECMMLEASAFESENKYQDAIVVYDDLVSRYPSSGFRYDALYRSATCRYQVSCKYPRDERTLKNALAALMAAFRENPEHDLAGITSKRIAELSQNLTAMNFEKAQFYDRIRRNPEAALIAYTEFLDTYPAAAEAPEARARIKQLKADLASAPAAGK